MQIMFDYVNTLLACRKNYVFFATFLKLLTFDMIFQKLLKVAESYVESRENWSMLNCKKSIWSWIFMDDSSERDLCDVLVNFFNTIHLELEICHERSLFAASFLASAAFFVLEFSCFFKFMNDRLLN